MTTRDQIRALVKAHYDRDEYRFGAYVHQIAAREKNEARRHELKALADRVHEVPAEAKPLICDVMPVQFDELVLPDSVAFELEQVALELEHATELEARGIGARRRLLFHGPPGNGKTSAAAALAARLNRTAYIASLPAIVGSHLGESSGRLSKLMIALAAPIVLVLDEIDAIGGERGASKDGAGREYNLIANTLLTLLDQHRAGVLVATTNRLDMLDPALVRRFDDAIEFPAPDTEQMAELARRLCDRLGVEFTVKHMATDAESFDAVTKHVMRVVRRSALTQIVLGKVEAAE